MIYPKVRQIRQSGSTFLSSKRRLTIKRKSAVKLKIKSETPSYLVAVERTRSFTYFLAERSGVRWMVTSSDPEGVEDSTRDPNLRRRQL